MSEQRFCKECGRVICAENTSGFCKHCFPKKVLSKKLAMRHKLRAEQKFKGRSRRRCKHCGIPIGEKNVYFLCLACRKKLKENPKIQFEAKVKVVMQNGRRVLVG